MWCSVSAEKIIKLIFFDKKINSERYVQQIVHPLFLSSQQLNAICITLHDSAMLMHLQHSWTVCEECLGTQLLAVVCGLHTSPTFTYGLTYLGGRGLQRRS
jgi:hypothetical protein